MIVYPIQVGLFLFTIGWEEEGGGGFQPIPSFHDINQPAYNINNNKSVSGELEG